MTFAESFMALKAVHGKLTRRVAILLSHEHDLSLRQCVARLEDNGLVKRGAWDWFVRNGGIDDDHVREVLGPAISLRQDDVE